MPDTCIVPGCAQPRKVGKNRQYQKCDQHWREAMTGAGRKPRQPEPASATETAITRAEAPALAPGKSLESLIREALAAQPEALGLRITGMRVQFEGEIDIKL